MLAGRVVVYEGVQIGAGCVIEDRARMENESTISDRTRIVYGAYLSERVGAEGIPPDISRSKGLSGTETGRSGQRPSHPCAAVWSPQQIDHVHAGVINTAGSPSGA